MRKVIVILTAVLFLLEAIRRYQYEHRQARELELSWEERPSSAPWHYPDAGTPDLITWPEPLLPQR